MKLKTSILLLILQGTLVFAQNEYHVFPGDHPTTPGSPQGDGSLSKPWNLSAALNQKQEKVNGGDKIWIHAGTYNGRFESNLESNNGKLIEIAPYATDKVVLNGNVNSKRNAVLQVRGGGVSFSDIEITFLGKFPRKEGEAGFKIVHGVDHLDGMGCRFVNLRVHNNPGSGVNSWKRTGGSSIINCKIFNNGWYSKVRGSGVGIYVHNQSDREKLIANNFIFNNYYKGIQVWSASSGAGFEYLKNITLKNNVIFNNGLGSGVHKDNLIIASDDSKGVNVPKNITVDKNILYHNTNFTKGSNHGNGTSMTLGWHSRAPLQDVVIKNNIIIGKNNALNFLQVKSFEFDNNIVYTGYIHLYKSAYQHLKNKGWKMEDNAIYSKGEKVFRILKSKDYTIDEFSNEFKTAGKSNRYHIKEFDLAPVLYKEKQRGDSNRFELVVFNKLGKAVNVDFSDRDIASGTPYLILDMENHQKIASGKVNAAGEISVPMGKHNKTADNFGVYTIDFSRTVKRKKGFFKRLFGWLF